MPPVTRPDYPRLATRLFNTPLAISTGKIEIVMAALAKRIVLEMDDVNGEPADPPDASP